MMIVQRCLQLFLAAAAAAVAAVVTIADDDASKIGGRPTTAQSGGYGYTDHGPRLFPAARLELYTPGNLVIGVVTARTLTVTTTTTSGQASSSSSSGIDRILQPAIARFRQSLTRLPDFHDEYVVNPSNRPLHVIDRVDIVVESADLTLYHGVKEDYELSIPDDSSSCGVLKATTVFGALRGLETLAQLLEFGWMSSPPPTDGSGAGGDAIFLVRDIPLFVSDEPAYPFRGLMIDTARHYLPLGLILDNLDAMAMNKLNVLHWHISDTQSFPYRSTVYPELAEKGAFHPQRVYTAEDVATVLHEAYLRGIRVIPEVDMPGHTNAIGKSHPEVMAHCPNPSEPMDPTVPETYTFIETLYRDLATVFPDEMVHVGGDEVELSERCWLDSPTIAKWMHEHHMGNRTVELYEHFETRLLEIVAGRLGKTPIVWQEVFNLNLTIPPHTVIDVWKGFDRDTLQDATARNYRTVLSGCWYLDHLGDTWETFYRCDPQNYTGSERGLTIGGHASMWGESVDASNFFSRVWPRTSAVAERLWTGGGNDDPSATAAAAATVGDRIYAFRCRMVLQGFPAGPTRPGSCPAEVRYEPRRDECGSAAERRKKRWVVSEEVAAAAAVAAGSGEEDDDDDDDDATRPA